MTPDERAQLDAYAIRFGMDSEDVDEALARAGGDSATLHMARAAVTAYALRRDLVAGREPHHHPCGTGGRRGLARAR